MLHPNCYAQIVDIIIIAASIVDGGTIENTPYLAWVTPFGEFSLKEWQGLEPPSYKFLRKKDMVSLSFHWNDLNNTAVKKSVTS